MFISAFIVGCGQDQSHQPTPYPFYFRLLSKAKGDYPRFCCTSDSSRLEERALGKCLVPAPCAGIKLIYCNSIKQQERNFLRQLKFVRSGIYEPAPRRSTCLLTPSTCCRNQTAPKISYEYEV